MSGMLRFISGKNRLVRGIAKKKAVPDHPVRLSSIESALFLFIIIIQYGAFETVFGFFSGFEFFLFVILELLIKFAFFQSAGVFFTLFPRFHGKS
jgi:hypothetical protein